MVYLKATLFDGSYHPVDSSEMAFKTAAQLAYKAGMPQASPVLLEPIGELKVTIPDSYMGDVIGDLNKRRGRVMGMNPDGEGNQVVEAEVPMAEMSRYAIDLRSMTQGRKRLGPHGGLPRWGGRTSRRPGEGHRGRQGNAGRGRLRHRAGLISARPVFCGRMKLSCAVGAAHGRLPHIVF